MEDIMTDKQFDKILKMVSMILDGCKDLDEAKEKVAELLEDQKKKSLLNKQTGFNRGAAGLPPKPHLLSAMLADYRWKVNKARTIGQRRRHEQMAG